MFLTILYTDLLVGAGIIIAVFIAAWLEENKRWKRGE